MVTLRFVCLLLIFITASTLIANAQQMKTGRHQLLTFADQVSVKVQSRNTFDKSVDIQVRVYDHNFKIIKARVSPREFRLPKGGVRNVNVTVPFLGETKKRFRICTERVPEAGNTQKVRTRVCGRFYASQVQQ